MWPKVGMRLLRHEITCLNTQSGGNAKEVTELQVILAQLCSLNRRPIHLGAMGQFLLRHIRVHPGVANLQAYPPAGIEDPVGLVCGTHLQKLNRRSS